MAVTELLPGDILSLFKGEGDMTVPCDALILRGSMVVNEAALTGESVPQMKEGAAADGAACEVMLDVEKVPPCFYTYTRVCVRLCVHVRVRVRVRVHVRVHVRVRLSVRVRVRVCVCEYVI